MNAPPKPSNALKPVAAIHPLSILRMLWKQKPLIVLVWLVLTTAGVLVVRLIPNVYRAESLILVDSQKIPERFVSSTVQGTLQDQLATIRQQILSATQLEKVIKKSNLYPDKQQLEEQIEQAQKDIGIAVERGWSGGRPGAFRISYQGGDPVVVASVVNELSGLFIAENLKTRALRAEGTSEFIDSQLREARKQLEEQEANYTRFKLQRTGELPEQQTALNATLGRLQTELQGHQDAINRAEQNKVMLENTLRVAESAEAMLQRSIQQITSPATVASETGPRVDYPTVAPVSAAPAPPPRHSETLKRQLEALRLRYHDEHPEIKRLLVEIAAAVQQESTESAAARPAEVAGQSPAGSPAATPPRPAPVVPQQLITDLNRERERVANTRTQLLIATKQMDANIADRQRVLRSIAEYQGKLDRVPMREQEMASITRDYETSKQNYQSLLDKKNSAELAAEMERRQQAERFTLQDPARVPNQPIKPKRMILNLAAVIAGLVIGMVVALGIEFRKNRLLGEWELPGGIIVLGRVPTIVIGKTVQPEKLQRKSGVVSHV